MLFNAENKNLTNRTKKSKLKSNINYKSNIKIVIKL